MMGGRLRYMVSGSAPISGEVLEFLKVCFCIPVMEGYGQTESSAVSFVTEAEDNTSGHVGGCTPNNEFKLQDIPEMDYYSTDKDEEGRLMPRGEICLRGPSVCMGYFD